MSHSKNRRPEQRTAANALAQQEKQMRMQQYLNNQFRAKLGMNGITPAMLKENYEIGYREGISDSTSMVTRASYAAAIIALRKVYGFGQIRMKRFLEEMDKQLLLSIDHDDLIEKAWTECGLKLVEQEPFERIQDV